MRTFAKIRNLAWWFYPYYDYVYLEGMDDIFRLRIVPKVGVAFYQIDRARCIAMRKNFPGVHGFIVERLNRPSEQVAGASHSMCRP